MLNDYRRDFESFHTSLAREHYLFHSGQKNSLELETIYERYAHLVDRDAIDGLSSEIDMGGHYASECTSLNRLLSFAVEHYLENSVRELTEQISQFEATATVEFNGRELTFQESAVSGVTERDRDSRNAIYDKRLVAIEASNSLRRERIDILHERAQSLGYPTYVALFETLRGLDYDQIALECELSMFVPVKPVAAPGPVPASAPVPSSPVPM